MKVRNFLKRVELSDGQPTSIDRNLASKRSKELADEIKELCKSKGVSYVEINKALYIADTELCIETISTNLLQS
ncbi:hypothetical protein P7H62_06230 [Vagococcus carniphilus]|uniref:hypothetical protein n=1 Tax=Vagococcus carniphilus TaxID=218144 RepID=UPI00288D9C11|nr:hypothetical protein [Vagococcus carniphilus]MDT2830878.1 hypothetical protein [Vagococcus carniphilus]MDT2854041.1 hypothetical protein [Vagococcus carniphilus]